MNIRYIVSKLDLSHFVFITITVGLNLALVLIVPNPIQFIGVLLHLAYKCNDPMFGNGKKYHWIRQGVLILGGLVVFLLGI